MGLLAPEASLPPGHGEPWALSLCLSGPSDRGWSSLLGVGTRVGWGVPHHDADSVLNAPTFVVLWRKGPAAEKRGPPGSVPSLERAALRAIPRAPGDPVYTKVSLISPGRFPKSQNSLDVPQARQPVSAPLCLGRVAVVGNCDSSLCSLPRELPDAFPSPTLIITLTPRTTPAGFSWLKRNRPFLRAFP